MARVFPAVSKKFEEVSDGKRIGGGLVFKAAPYLPIVEYNDFERLDIVIKAGTIVALDEFGYIAPANGGANTVTLTYSTLDAQRGVYDYDSFTGSVSDTKVTAAKTTTKKLASNVPIGVAQYDIFRWDMENDPNYKVQNTFALLEDYLVLTPIENDMETTYGIGTSLGQYHSGALVTSDVKGRFIPFVPETENITATGSAYSIVNLEQVVGKIIKVEDVAVDPSFTGGYENVSTVPGLGLGGKENGGLPHGIDATTKKGIFVQLQF